MNWQGGKNSLLWRDGGVNCIALQVLHDLQKTGAIFQVKQTESTILSFVRLKWFWVGQQQRTNLNSENAKNILCPNIVI